MKILAETPPDRLDYHDAARLHGYAALARHLHPGAMGEFVAREFEHWAGCGYAADPGGQLYRVAADLDAQVERRLQAERERWAAGSPPKPAHHPAPPTTPAPTRSAVSEALRAASDAITWRVHQ